MVNEDNLFTQTFSKVSLEMGNHSSINKTNSFYSAIVLESPWLSSDQGIIIFLNLLLVE